MKLQFLCCTLLLGIAACQSPAPASTTKGPFPAAATFQVEHGVSVPVPAGAKEVRVWFPLPRKEDGQTIRDEKIEAPAGWKEATDNQGNRYVYAAVANPGDKVTVKTTFTVERKEQHGALDASKT